MAVPIVYQNFVPPAIDAGNLNTLNQVIYQILGDGTNAPPTAAAARTNLGLGTLAVQNATAVTITGGTVSGLTGASVQGRLINVQTLTSSGTYTPTAGTTSIVVEAMGASGGSAGAPATGVSQFSAGTPGGAGAYCKSRFTSGFSGISYTVGIAGAAGGAGTAGGAGGASTFLGMSAGGGLGGTALGPNTSIVTGGVVPGVATGGNILNINGSFQIGMVLVAGQLPLTPPGTNTLFGTGGSVVGSTSSASTGLGYGATGGWSLVATSSTGAQTGSAGLPGVIFVYEYS